MESNTIKINKQKLRKHYKQAARMKRLGKIAINRARVRIGNIEIQKQTQVVVYYFSRHVKKRRRMYNQKLQRNAEDRRNINRACFVTLHTHLHTKTNKHTHLHMQ